MSQFTEKVSTKSIEKILKSSIKKEITAKGINVTNRRGNRELKFLISKIANYPFKNLEQANVAGEKLGQHLAQLFQQKNQQNLDADVIQQVSYQKNVWSLAGLSIAEIQSIKAVSKANNVKRTLATQIIEPKKSEKATTEVVTPTTKENNISEADNNQTVIATPEVVAPSTQDDNISEAVTDESAIATPEVVTSPTQDDNISEAVTDEIAIATPEVVTPSTQDNNISEAVTDESAIATSEVVAPATQEDNTSEADNNQTVIATPEVVASPTQDDNISEADNNQTVIATSEVVAPTTQDDNTSQEATDQTISSTTDVSEEE
ncbi:MAG TPA: hypothetical protein ACFCUY_05500 [Xenococcaceae cyanobacterium]